MNTGDKAFNKIIDNMKNPRFKYLVYTDAGKEPEVIEADHVTESSVGFTFYRYHDSGPFKWISKSYIVRWERVVNG